MVHDIHGKGKYLGLKTLEAGGNVAEYMELEYRGGDKLYIPTAQIDRVQKYIGSEDAPPQLSKLGGKEWETAKTKARESALKLAFDLVDLLSLIHIYLKYEKQRRSTRIFNKSCKATYRIQ